MLPAWVVALSLLAAPVSLAGEPTVSERRPRELAAAPSSIVITAPADVTPQTDATISVEVADPDTMADITEIEIRFYYGGAGHSGGGDPQDRAILTWIRGGSPEWTIDQGSGTTWAINTGQVPPDGDTTGTWVFSFKPGKVATMGDWGIHVTVTDGEPTPTEADYGGSVAMNWYGEISLDPGLTIIDWGIVELGSGFSRNKNKVTGISATYISNGDYSGQIQAAGNWSGAYLDPTGQCTNQNEFALQANYYDKFTGATGAELVETSPVTIYDSGTQTGEAGQTNGDNTLWLKVADTFIGKTFQGPITYLIASG